MAGEPRENDLNRPKPGYFDNSEHGRHRASRSEIAAQEACLLVADAGKIERGNAAASDAALREVLSMKNGGYLKDVAQNLEKSGNAKIAYGPNGEVEHIVFNGENGKPSVDMDLQHETVDGKSSTQLREAEVKQAKEFIAAGLADPKMTDAAGKPLTPEAQACANDLIGALLDGDVQAMTKASQKIMQDPDMTDSIQSVLKRIQAPSSVTFAKDAKGQPYMQVSSGENDAVIVPATGSAYATGLDILGEPDQRKHPSLDATMQSASNWGLFEASTKIGSVEEILEPTKRFPDMKSLAGAWAERQPGEADERRRMIDAVSAIIMKHQLGQRRDFDEDKPREP